MGRGGSEEKSVNESRRRRRWKKEMRVGRAGGGVFVL